MPLSKPVNKGAKQMQKEATPVSKPSSRPAAKKAKEQATKAVVSELRGKKSGDKMSGSSVKNAPYSGSPSVAAKKRVAKNPMKGNK